MSPTVPVVFLVPFLFIAGYGAATHSWYFFLAGVIGIIVDARWLAVALRRQEAARRTREPRKDR